MLFLVFPRMHKASTGCTRKTPYPSISCDLADLSDCALSVDAIDVCWVFELDLFETDRMDGKSQPAADVDQTDLLI